MTLVIKTNALSRASKKKKPEYVGDTKDRITSAAIHLFSENGYDGTSTKEICESASVNIAALHYHFESKENLYLSIIRKLGEESLGSALRTLSDPSDAAELRIRLEMFLHESLELCFRNLDLARIVMNESVLLHPRSHEIFMATFFMMSEKLISFFAAAAKKKIISREIDPRFFADIIFAQISQVIRHQPLDEKFCKPSLTDPKYRRKWVQSMVQIVLEGALPRSS